MTVTHAGQYGKETAGSRWNNSTIYGPGVLFPFFIDFRVFPAGNGDFS
jgi:hypothetical protein